MTLRDLQKNVNDISGGTTNSTVERSSGVTVSCTENGTSTAKNFSQNVRSVSAAIESEMV